MDDERATVPVLDPHAERRRNLQGANVHQPSPSDSTVTFEKVLPLPVNVETEHQENLNQVNAILNELNLPTWWWQGFRDVCDVIVWDLNPYIYGTATEFKIRENYTAVIECMKMTGKKL